ncbi:hypothetical protein CPB84DRAFT_1753132 [Gymnopilus junonius]|uniref:Uncharacterized protein n=1 Tax=Gymnopilus junonius TaxID=109634 RepID=A0A9P5NAZ5_GYMJU|nr:hypothetical protein CPB84DRAFT_1753132 [Gymnopilus junonius]
MSATIKWYSSDISLLSDILIKGDELKLESPIARKTFSELAEVAEMIHGVYHVLLTAEKIRKRIEKTEPHTLGGSRSEDILLCHLINRLEQEKAIFIIITSQYSKMIGNARDLLNSSEDTPEDDLSYEMIIRNMAELREQIEENKSKFLNMQQALIKWEAYTNILILYYLMLITVVGLLATAAFILIVRESVETQRSMTLRSSELNPNFVLGSELISWALRGIVQLYERTNRKSIPTRPLALYCASKALSAVDEVHQAETCSPGGS